MEYKALPFSSVWENGIFNLPTKLVDEYLKLASEYQLKALLYIFIISAAMAIIVMSKSLNQLSTISLCLTVGFLCLMPVIATISFQTLLPRSISWSFSSASPILLIPSSLQFFAIALMYAKLIDIPFCFSFL